MTPWRPAIRCFCPVGHRIGSTGKSSERFETSVKGTLYTQTYTHLAYTSLDLEHLTGQLSTTKG